ncbi:N-acyl homoserine lactonase [mine drainage metagenome]|uniref:N-acyl homoserine lactonase n=1 Tax=mine drainage metagenome TaxID=410659 RepID=A0A1J5P265_9ZZZZ
MNGHADIYKIFAIKYATTTMKRSTFFVPPLLPEGPLAFDYYVWLIVNEDRAILVDTGFQEEAGARRGRSRLRCPIESLSLCKISADQINDVIMTHLHYDHAGNMHLLKNARFHIQHSEIEFATSAMMSIPHPSLGGSMEVRDIRLLIDLIFEGRVHVLHGFTEFAPGIELHHIGGHTPGQQIVRVRTQRGWVVLANDACHFEENILARRPISVFVDLRAMYTGFDTVLQLADADLTRVIPGHDPIVMHRFPASEQSLRGIIARLDLPPLA